MNSAQNFKHISMHHLIITTVTVHNITEYFLMFSYTAMHGTHLGDPVQHKNEI